MVEVARTHDRIRLGYLQALLAEAGVEAVVFDGAAQSVWPGAIPARLMVDERQAWLARSVLKDAVPEH